MADNILEMKNICKSFPGVKALDNASLTVRRGTVHALMGENGAGKSTLMKCLFGIYKKDSGTIKVDGEEIEFTNSKDALENGVAMVHQELNQALKRSVMDNLWLGRYPTKFGIMTDEKKMYDDTMEIFNMLNIEIDPREILERLSVSKRQMVEIAKAVSYNSKIIVFDEPTSSLTDREVNHLFEIIKMLKSKGCGIIYISHKMDEIMRISDDITVMRDGVHVDTQKAEDLTIDKIIKLMVGRELTKRFPEKTNTIGDVIMEIKNLKGMYNHIDDISFELRKGEILGIAGLDGSGRTEILETIFGLAAKDKGDLIIHGKKRNIKSPSDAIKAGMAMLTEERRANGIFAILSILENTTISNLSKYRKLGIALSEKLMKKDTKWAIDAMRIKTPQQSTQIRTLSGGNQQKVIFGRWLLTNPEILLLDEPTRGIDVGAKYEIYQLIVELAHEDKGVIMVSSEMPELLGVCDRIIVVSGGRIAGELLSKDASQEKIMELAAKYA